MAVQVAREASKPKTRLTVYDTDVHHGWMAKTDLLPYLDPEYHDRFTKYGIDASLMQMANNGGVRGYRADVLVDGKVPDGTGVAAPSAEITRDQLLDGVGIDWALLTSGPVAASTFHPELEYSNALARAFNDFTVERWLAVDGRFRYALSVNPRDPEAAVEEIDRLGDHPAVVGVMFLGGAPMPYGQRFYRPIHEACVERNLVWSIHFGSEGQSVNAPPSAAGYPSYYGEMRANRASSYKAHLASFVFEGVFERYPTFKVAMLEAGFAWVPAFLWSMDQAWAETGDQTPWVRRPPSEYVFENVRFASQPEDEPRPKDGLAKILEWMHADRTLMFATDYPHWDWDDPAETFKTLPPKLKERIFSKNAMEFFRS
jgi:predicted TIM-barrel fold metal-dependent hydrolase